MKNIIPMMGGIGRNLKWFKGLSVQLTKDVNMLPTSTSSWGLSLRHQGTSSPGAGDKVPGQKTSISTVKSNSPKDNNNDSKCDRTMSDAALPNKPPPPELPTTCCMSGCANCVWIEYAEELSAYYKDSGEKAKEAISKIPDPNLRAFIQMEVKFR